MAGYRDDHDAAMARAEALEQELRALRSQQSADKDRIFRLEAELKAKQASISRMQAGLVGSPYGELSTLPSNANTVLIVGVLAFAMCQLLGPVAWHMANQELQRIDLGEADPTKRGLVMAGKILGMISTGLMAISFLFFLFAMIMSSTTAPY